MVIKSAEEVQLEELREAEAEVLDRMEDQLRAAGRFLLPAPRPRFTQHPVDMAEGLKRILALFEGEHGLSADFIVESTIHKVDFPSLDFKDFDWGSIRWTDWNDDPMQLVYTLVAAAKQITEAVEERCSERLALIDAVKAERDAENGA